METSHISLKRAYPFANEELQLPREELPPGFGSKHKDGPWCLLGSVCDVNGQLRRQTGQSFFPPPPSLVGSGPSISFHVRLVGDYFELLDGERAFAHLDKSFCSGARRLADLGVSFKACVERSRWEAFERAWIPYRNKDDIATFAVDVSVYSLRHHADNVGNILLRSSIFLQHPAHSTGSEVYYNPQILNVDGFEGKPDEVMSEPSETSAPFAVPHLPVQSDPELSGNLTNSVDLILDSLSHTNILHEIRTDTNRIKTDLKKHQMTALDFIAQRESGKPPTGLTLWRERRAAGETHFEHVLTKGKALECREARGGIIADDMGLGKSLTMLSAIASSINDAANFASTWNGNAIESSNSRVPSKATLIMVPSTILIDNWIHEIHLHTYMHKVTFHRHVGTDRQSEAQFLLEKDVVFTTFATALKDFKAGDSPLAKIHWFRVVLDEAHNIRNCTTQQFQAVQQLQAQRRWCLTGTPIQNRLEDLGSLISFLRVPELENAPTFRTCIIVPASPNRGRQFQNLQILLNAVCLRRTKEILGLPEPIVHLRILHFSAQERCQYDELYKHYGKYVQMAVSGVSSRNVASTTLRSINELRLFCNNGPRKIRDGLHESEEEIWSYFEQLGLTDCSNCSQPIHCIDQRDGAVLIPSCKHLVCRSCLPQCLDKNSACVLCASGKSPPDFANHVETRVSNSAEETATAPEYPSKLLALLEDLKMEPKNKCIVFSSWSKTLGLAAELLKRAGLKHDIIDGKLSLKRRLKVLEQFTWPSGPNILLMTLGTGAEGLNLTVASRIYILEPQWNPFTELQAIGRAQRIGQTKQVVCIQYVMKESIEQSDILNRQKVKTALAGSGFKGQKLQNSLQYFRVEARVPRDSILG